MSEIKTYEEYCKLEAKTRQLDAEVFENDLIRMFGGKDE